MPLLGFLHLLIAVGSVACILIELLPELADTRRARQVAKDLHTVVDPDRDWRRLHAQVQESEVRVAQRNFD